MKKVVMWVLWFIALAGMGTMLAAALLRWNEIAIPSGVIGVVAAFILMILDEEWKRDFYRPRTKEVNIVYFRKEKKVSVEKGVFMRPYPLVRH